MLFVQGVLIFFFLFFPLFFSVHSWSHSALQLKPEKSFQHKAARETELAKTDEDIVHSECHCSFLYLEVKNKRIPASLPHEFLSSPLLMFMQINAFYGAMKGGTDVWPPNLLYEALVVGPTWGRFEGQYLASSACDSGKPDSV